MREVPSSLLQLLKDTFKKCDDVFLEHRDLWHIFGDSRLYIWQDSLPEAFNVSQRIERTIYYLQSKENAQGENALILFTNVIGERYSPDDKRHDLLLTIIEELQLAPPLSPTRKHEVLAEANPLQEPMLAISELEQIRQRAHSVALIELTRYRKRKSEYRETGTGWLIAPGLLLTCWHVVAALPSADEPSPAAADLQLQIEHMLLSFNHTEINTGGKQYRVSALEYPLNGNDQQDFAILRLEDRSTQSHRQLGYLPIELDTPFTNQTQLSIIQHPLGQYQQVAVNGRFFGHSQRAGRILYSTVTDAGTSGAPVLNHYNLYAVAVHNGENREASLREGTMIKYILSELQEKKPDLYNEIVEAQRAINNSLPSIRLAKSHDPDLHSSETTLHASFPSTIFTKQEVTLYHPDKDTTFLEKDSQKDVYSYVSTCNCASSNLSLAFHPNGQYLASGDNIGTIKLWNIPATSLLYTLKNDADATPSIAFSPDGHYLASGSDDGTIKLWNFLSRKREKTLQRHTEWITCLVFSSNGQYMVSSSDDKSIKVWNIPYWTIAHHLKESAEVSGIALNPFNQVIAACISGQPVKLWNVFSSKVSSSKESLTGVRSLVFSPNGRYLATGDDEGSIALHETTTWKTVHKFALHSSKIHCLAFHPNSQLLASGGEDQTVQLWNVQTGTSTQTLTKHTDRIESIAFSPDGQFIASGGRDAKIILWKHV